MDVRAEFEQLLADLFDGPPNAARNQRLDALLRAHPEFQGEYLDHLQLHALLQWRGGKVVPQDKAQFAKPRDGHPWAFSGRSSRGLAAALLALAACLALFFFLQPPEAQATPDLVVRLIDWNLDLTQARSRDERSRIFEERAGNLKSTLAQTELTPEDRALAESLFDASSQLTRNVDPMAEADLFNDIADKLVARIDAATQANDEKRTVQLADTYGRLKELGVDANLDRAVASGAIDAEKKQKLATLCHANRTNRLAEIVDRNPESPSRKAIRRAMKGQFHKTKKHQKPPD